jgi:CIC family chloride channel protein
MNNTIFYSYGKSEMVFILVFNWSIISKIISSSLTTASGGIGGVFAPSLLLEEF